jgi:pilus assembly protein FimV
MTGTLQRLSALFLLTCPTALFALGLGDIRLNSALNEPLDAEIELVGAAPDELTSLRATLANPETFTRYGLERSAFLTRIEFKVGQGRDGRPALLVRSRESVPDPFLTLLVDVNWSRGRLLREYTMLLDPPVYTPGAEQAANAPVSAPQAGETETPRSGSVQRAPEPPAPAAPPPSPASRAPEGPSDVSAGSSSSYTVRTNDTLWRIASGLKPGATSDVNRMMLAIYRSNPEAFSGTINDMRAGAILRLPSDTEFEAVDSSEASAEVRRQYAEWRANRGIAASGAPSGERLRLVTPTEGGEGAGTQTADSGAQSKELRDKVQQLQTQLDESRRMLQLKDAELAKLQQKLGQPAQPPAPTPTPAPAETPTPAPIETQPAPTETPPEATTTPPVEPETTPAEQPKPPAPQAPVEEKPSILDWAIAHWYYALAALLVLILLWLAARRRRHEPDFSKLGRLADAARSGAAREPRMEREPVTTTLRAARPPDDAFLVEESGERQRPKIVKAAEPARAERAKAEPARGKSADDTLSSETAINLDQGDPLAEADFHMAYGLYDQAADLVRIAIEREPNRRDLKLKLLEIFFVWGNKDAFLQAARELAQTRQDAGPGEWEKIAIMGRQISPDDPMFAQTAGAAGAAAADVDLNLEGGENRVDLDLLGPPESETGGAIDLDLGTVVGADDSSADTGESPALKGHGLDFPLEDQPTRISDGTATTREMTARTMETPTIETETYRSSEVPTVESPLLRGRDSPTIKEKIDSALFRKDEAGTDQTAELALDDLGLELNELAAAQSDPLEETDHPSNAPTMLAGLDEKSRRLLAEAEARRGRLADDEDTKISPTGTWVLEDKTMAETLALPGAPERDTSATTARNRALSGDGTGDTARRRRIDSDSTAEMRRGRGEEMDLDLDRLEAALTSDTIKQPRRAAEEERFASDVFGAKDLAATDLDLDVGEVRQDRDRAPTSTARIPADEMGLPELEPVTMSEVGTKLDLARAYMDMGDPEGARSILEEVLQEGSSTQKQEAQRLIESLPG